MYKSNVRKYECIQLETVCKSNEIVVVPNIRLNERFIISWYPSRSSLGTLRTRIKFISDVGAPKKFLQ